MSGLQSQSSSQTGGARAMSIQGRLYRERERLAGCGMTEKEREWRAQWIRDQRLSSSEPRAEPKIYRELYNPIRRLYRYPMDLFEEKMACRVGAPMAWFCRGIISKSIMGLFGVYAIAYYFKYNANDWTRKGGFRVISSRKSVVPGDPNWPQGPNRFEPSDYADRGFKNSSIQKPLVMTDVDHHNVQVDPAVVTQQTK